MNRRWIWLVLLVLLTPVILRTVWFYRGVYRPSGPLEAPAYGSFIVDPIAVGNDLQTPATGSENQGLVLLDYQHDNQFAFSEVQSLLDRVRAQGGRVELLVDSFDSDSALLSEQLKAASSWITIAPTRAFSDFEVEELSSFVASGGRLVVITDPTRSGFFSDVDTFAIGDVSAANSLIERFGMRFSQDYLYNILENEGNFRNIFLRSVGNSELAANIDRITFYGTRSVAGEGSVRVFTGGDGTLSSRTDQGGSLAAAALGANGDVLALGDLTFLTSPYNQTGDNPILIANLAHFLLTAERSRSITDFPYFFDAGLLLFTSDDSLPLAAETLPTIKNLRESLAAQGIELVISAEAEDEDELPQQKLLTGLYDGEDPPESILSAAGVTLPGDSESGELVIEGLGEISSAGTSLAILDRDEEYISLVILSDTTENLLSALDVFLFVDYSSCLLNDHLALCSVGPGDGFDSSTSDDLDFGDEFLPDDLEDSLPTEEEESPTPEPGE